jgi:hypothetical protein
VEELRAIAIPLHGSPFQHQPLDLCVKRGHALEGGKGLDGFSSFLLRDAEIVQGLQVDPELCAGAEEMSQAQRRVGGDVAVPIQNLGDAVGGNLEMARQCGGAHLEFRELLG